MIKIIKCELLKFKNTYFTIISFFGMIFPIVLLTMIFLISKEDFIKYKRYNWDKFNEAAIQMYIFLLCPLVVQFLSIFTIYYEITQKTFKNLITSPVKRYKTICAKIFFVTVFVLICIICNIVLDIVAGFFLGFQMNKENIYLYTRWLFISSVSSLFLIPLSMIFTLISRNFVLPIIIAFIGVIPNIFAYHWDKLYLSPWAIPENILLALLNPKKFNIIYPLISMPIYGVIFIIVIFICYYRYEE